MKFFASRWTYGTTRRLARLVVGDVDKMIHYTAKSFRDDEILRRLRQRPSGPLLASMARRLGNFDHARIAQRTANGRLLTDLLRGHVLCPGAEVEPHNYWLYPVMMSDTSKAIATLEAAGFDATHVQSMTAIEAPADRPELDPVRTKQALAHMVLVPCYPGMPEAELRRMADVLIKVESESTRVEAMKVTLKSDDTAYDRANQRADEALAR
jgi:dTDP-4-amino-4,6-dideoxygalactose transaminase